MSRRHFLHSALVALTLAAGISAPGAVAGEGGIGGTGISAFGPIQRFGSIFVGGREYPLTGARITIDGRPAARRELRLGQVVLVHARVTGHGLRVASIRVRHALEGPIAGMRGREVFVLGQTIEMPRGLAVDGERRGQIVPKLRPGDIIRVSGLRERSGLWVASRITRVGHAQGLRRYPVLLRATLRRMPHGGLAIGKVPVSWRGSGPLPVDDLGRVVRARGTMSGGRVDIDRMTPDVLRLGPPGTEVRMSGYLEGHEGAWRANGIRLGLAGHVVLSPGLASLTGRVDSAGILVVESVRPVVPLPELSHPVPRRAEIPAIEHPGVGRPPVHIPEIERPEFDR
ncbi:MAG: DUF5666 domain-containing protein [Acidiferrobacteraceae bacterium]